MPQQRNPRWPGDNADPSTGIETASADVGRAVLWGARTSEGVELRQARVIEAREPMQMKAKQDVKRLAVRPLI